MVTDVKFSELPNGLGSFCPKCIFYNIVLKTANLQQIYLIKYLTAIFGMELFDILFVICFEVTFFTSSFLWEFFRSNIYIESTNLQLWGSTVNLHFAITVNIFSEFSPFYALRINNGEL